MIHLFFINGLNFGMRIYILIYFFAIALQCGLGEVMILRISFIR